MFLATTRNYVSSILTSDFLTVYKETRGDRTGNVREGQIGKWEVSNKDYA
jgi:hypothetical protein